MTDEDQKADDVNELSQRIQQLEAANADLQSRYENAEGARRKLSADLDAHRKRWGDMTPDAARAALEFQQSHEGLDSDARYEQFKKATETRYRSEYEGQKGQLVQNHQQREEQWNTERDSMLRQMAAWGRDAKVRSFIGDKGNADLAVRLAAAESRLEQLPDGSWDFVMTNAAGQARLDDNGRAVLLDSAMQSWRDDPVYKPLFAGHGVQGGGTPAGGQAKGAGRQQQDVAKAFDAEAPNLSAIMDVAKSDPARAKALAAKAGVDLPL